MRSVLIAIPAHNESIVIEENVSSLVSFCRAAFAGRPWRILIAENGSSDDTFARATVLAAQFPEVTVKNFPVAGKGAAIRAAWNGALEEILMFMDADLSTALRAIPEAIEKIESGSDLVIGSRRVQGAEVKRSLLREAGSRAFISFARTSLRLPYTDFQCGFKAMKREAALKLLVECTADRWFFDIELIAFAHAAGFVVTELPVEWVESRNEKRRNVVTASSVGIFFSMALDVWRLRGRLRD